MDSLNDLTSRVLAFRDARDWEQFHNPKDLALAMSIEVAEVLELFRFKTPAEIADELPELHERLQGELADVFNFLLLLSHACRVNLGQALTDKLEVLEERYPVELARGKRVKYTELPR